MKTYKLLTYPWCVRVQPGAEYAYPNIDVVINVVHVINTMRAVDGYILQVEQTHCMMLLSNNEFSLKDRVQVTRRLDQHLNKYIISFIEFNEKHKEHLVLVSRHFADMKSYRRWINDFNDLNDDVIKLIV